MDSAEFVDAEAAGFLSIAPRSVAGAAQDPAVAEQRLPALRLVVDVVNVKRAVAEPPAAVGGVGLLPVLKPAGRAGVEPVVPFLVLLEELLSLFGGESGLRSLDWRRAVVGSALGVNGDEGEVVTELRGSF